MSRVSKQNVSHFDFTFLRVFYRPESLQTGIFLKYTGVSISSKNKAKNAKIRKILNFLSVLPGFSCDTSTLSITNESFPAKNVKYNLLEILLPTLVGIAPLDQHLLVHR